MNPINKPFKIADRKYAVRSFLIISCLFLQFACSDFIQIGPPKTEIISQSVFSTDASAKSAIRGIYSMMMSDESFTNGEIEKYCGLSADELIDHTGDAQQQEFFNNSLVVSNGIVQDEFWSAAYRYINNANAMLEGLGKATTLTEQTKSNLIGEAKFVRAYCHFYLVNLFGDIPYVETTDYRINSTASRMSTADVYDKIVQDLVDAEQLLSADFSFSQNQRIEPNKGAATALLARVHLYMQNWSDAITSSTAVINNSATYSLVSDLNGVFLANSTETIWQLAPVTPENSTAQARMFLLTIAPNYASLSDEFYQSFEPGDNRKTSWVGVFNDGTSDQYYPFKYKVYSSDVATEYSTQLRLAEQYLIRAEALARQNNVSAAVADLDAIRARAGLPLVQDTNPSISQDDLLFAIEKERRAELFSESGHRWLDLNRTGRSTAVLSLIKTDWQPTDALYPVPQSEIKLDPSLSQNPGY